MGYKKLDEVMELLTDELDGFNRSIERLEQVTENVDNIKIEPDTSEIESMIREHLSTERSKSSKLLESINGIEKQLSKARLVPKVQLWLHYSIWFISILVIGYLSFKVSRIDIIQGKAFSEGEQMVLSSLREYLIGIQNSTNLIING